MDFAALPLNSRAWTQPGSWLLRNSLSLARRFGLPVSVSASVSACCLLLRPRLGFAQYE